MSDRRKLTITAVANSSLDREAMAQSAVNDYACGRFYRDRGSVLLGDGGGWSWELGDADAKEPASEGKSHISDGHGDFLCRRDGGTVAPLPYVDCLECLRANAAMMQSKVKGLQMELQGAMQEIAAAEAVRRLDAVEARGAKRNAVSAALEEFGKLVFEDHFARQSYMSTPAMRDGPSRKKWLKCRRRLEKACENLLDLACGVQEENAD